MTTVLSAQEWHEAYLSPFTSDEKLRETIDNYGGFAGWVLDGVLSVKDIDADEATDSDCLEAVMLLVSQWAEATARGVDNSH